jgi:hypothetical protein
MIINTAVYSREESGIDKSINLTTSMNTHILITDNPSLILNYTWDDSEYDEINVSHYSNSVLWNVEKLTNSSNTWDVSSLIIEDFLNIERIIGVNYEGEIDILEYKILYYPEAINMTFEINSDRCYTLSEYISPESPYSLNVLPYGYTEEGAIRELTVIGAGVFQADHYLISIVLPNTINKIESNAFVNANNLSSLTIHAITPPILEGDPFLNTETQITIFVPANSLIDYQNTWGTITTATITAI